MERPKSVELRDDVLSNKSVDGGGRCPALLVQVFGEPAEARSVEVEDGSKDAVFEDDHVDLLGQSRSILNLQPISIWNVKTTATGLTASTTQQAPAGQLLPIGLFGNSAQSFTAGELYNITDATLNNPGNFGWLTWQGGQSAGTVDTSVCTANNPAFTLPTWITGSTGVKQQGGNSGNPGTTLACLNYYMDNAIPVLLPVYDGVTDGTSTSCGSKTANGSNTQYCIIGVVSMLITNVNWGPGIKEIDGTFQSVYQFQPGSIPAGVGAQPPAPGSQVYYLGLVH